MSAGSGVLVVGGGPAGASTAFFLARAGVEVTLVDRARFPRPKPCSEYLSPEASRVLHAMGALEELERAGSAQLAGMVVRSPDGGRIEGAFAAAHGWRGFRDRGLAVRRERLDAVLLERARAAGACVVEGERVASLRTDHAGRVTGAITLDDQGAARERSAALVVGADGLRSIVARRLGLARRARWPRRVALVTHYRGIAELGDVGEMHVERDGYLGIAHVGDGVANVAVVVPARRAGRAIAGRAEAFVEEWIAARPQLAPRFAGAERVSPVRATGPFASRARRAWAPGAALVGDAADFFDPFTGEGIYTALRGGELLAEHVAHALSGPRETDRALAAYDRRRRALFGGKWTVERLIALAVASPPLLNHAARALARRPDMADLLVGVVGDFVPAREVLRMGFLARLLLP